MIFKAEINNNNPIYSLTITYSDEENEISFPWFLDSEDSISIALSSAFKFARSILGEDSFSVDGDATSAINKDEKPAQRMESTDTKLSLDGDKTQVNSYQASFDLPERSEFEGNESRRELAFLSAHLNYSVPDGSNTEQVLKFLRDDANNNLLPHYQTKIGYLSKMLNEESTVFSRFNEAVVNAYSNLLKRCEKLEDDILISDVESLAQKFGYVLPDEKLDKTPFIFFETLHKEDLDMEIAAQTNNEELRKTA